MTAAPDLAPARLLPDELRLGPVRLRVTDLVRSTAFLQDALGLTRHDDAPDGIARFGTPDGSVVLELEEQPGARRAGRHAGLYHVAVLYPSRAELARAIERIAALRLPIDGASDHGTHEALYLPDPDGNGFELAADRPRSAWPDVSDVEEIRPRALDMPALLATAGGDAAVPARASDGLVVGHLHLHVGDVAVARATYVDAVGFDLVTSLPSAAFVSAGGYHHHLACNTWKGEGVGPAPEDAVGLVWWTALVPSSDDLDALIERLVAGAVEHRRLDDGAVALRDPWGIELRVSVDPARTRG